MHTVLIVEDEPAIRQLITFALTRAGFASVEAADTNCAQRYLKQNTPDLILMDWMLPQMSGLAFTECLKCDIATQHIPIIMLTAKDDELDKLRGFQAGIDDYVTKPFSPSELIARIQAVLRRAHNAQKGAPDSSQLIQFEGLQLDALSHRAMVNHTELTLGPTEFRLLKFFMQHPERVYSREELLSYAWERSVFVEARTVDVHILRLRKTLAPFGCDHYLQTVRGAGYRFSPYPQLALQQMHGSL